MQNIFHKFANKTSQSMGSPWAFILAVLIILLWLLSGPAFDYSDTWQLAINTGTTIITFIMVFVIQHTQNRDAQAMHLKLDEVIKSLKNARNRLVNIENSEDKDIKKLQEEFEKIQNRASKTKKLLAGKRNRPN